MKYECDFTRDRRCVFIEGKQYICLDRFLEVKNQNDAIMKELQKKVGELEEENKTLRDAFRAMNKNSYALTVEAIPVEWLLSNIPIDSVMQEYNRKLIEYLVTGWREENEATKA